MADHTPRADAPYSIMKQKPPPEGLIEARPAIADDPNAGQHPSNGPSLGVPPSKYSRALHDQIVGLIEDGNRPHVAAGIAGITASTFYGWLKAGREGHDVHLAEFARDIELAGHKAEGKAVETVRKDLLDNPDNAKWWLERARSDGYSKQVKTIVESQIADFLKRLEEALPADIFLKVLEVYAGSVTIPENDTPSLH